MLSKIVKRKTAAFNLGTSYFNSLWSEFNSYTAQTVSSHVEAILSSLNMVPSKELIDQMREKFIGFNVIDVTNFVYNNPKFYEYLKYSFLGKYYEKKIILIEWLIVILFVLLGVVSYFIFGLSLFFIISVVVLYVGLLLIFLFLFKNTGESYKSYYNRTMFSFLMSVYGNINFNFLKFFYLTDTELNSIIDQNYDKKKSNNNISFTGKLCNGNILDLDLTKTIEIRHKDGRVTKSTKKIFDGFYLKIDVLNNKNLFRGNLVKIRSDETVFSSLAEDTVKGIYESDREISFNSEEMNKSFDGRISGYNGFASVDDMLIQVQKVITPSFEEHLLFLRERYNSFNMNISDTGLVMSVNMDRSIFQQIKHKEFLDFKSTYREANEHFKIIKSDLYGIEDFTYYNVFPFLERLYLINYLTYLYLSYMDFDNYYSLNSSTISNYEKNMREIFTMDNKEFREKYTDKIKEIKDNTKNCIEKFEKEVEKNG